jgi:hypothetical protein
MDLSHLTDDELIAKLHGFGVKPHHLLVEELPDSENYPDERWCVSLGFDEPIGNGATRYDALFAAVNNWDPEWFLKWQSATD